MQFNIPLLINGGLVFGGLIVLLWSADKFIDGAADTARHFGMSPLMVGMLIVGFGTSAPEMIVSAFASLNGSAGIALGNAYGSNIANIGLVLGITALFYPLQASKRIVTREIPLLIAVLIVCFILFYNSILTRFESAVMLIGIIAIMVVNTLFSGENCETIEDNDNDSGSLVPSIIWLTIGLALLLISSHYLVQGAVGIAEAFGVSDLVIGLTVIAVGTSLPELASSLAAAKKGESEIVLGNIIGSCMFNALAVVGISGIIHNITINDMFMRRDFATGFVLTLLLLGLSISRNGGKSIGRIAGALLLSCYIGYTGYLLITL